VVAAEVDEMDDGEFVERDSLLGADGLQRGVDVRQVSERDVADAGVNDFVFAHAAMEPAEEESELDDHREERGEEANEGWLGECEIVEWHGCVWVAGSKEKTVM
jgi:hypothetical protein